MLPYRSADHAIRGVLLEFLRAPPGRKLGELPLVLRVAERCTAAEPDRPALTLVTMREAPSKAAP